MLLPPIIEPVARALVQAIPANDAVICWTRHFGVTKDELTRAIERLGNSAAAVRKQLGVAGQYAVLTP
jgi:hypothetical protein